MEGEQHPKATSANAALVGLAMTLTEAIVEEAALGWFQELGYAVLPCPQLAPGEPAAERDSFADVVQVGPLRQAIGRLNPTIPKGARE
jgi:type I restriction enzyme R subunit